MTFHIAYHVVIFYINIQVWFTNYICFFLWWIIMLSLRLEIFSHLLHSSFIKPCEASSLASLYMFWKHLLHLWQLNFSMLTFSLALNLLLDGHESLLWFETLTTFSALEYLTVVFDVLSSSFHIFKGHSTNWAWEYFHTLFNFSVISRKHNIYKC